jgi:hypothetical protein
LNPGGRSLEGTYPFSRRRGIAIRADLGRVSRLAVDPQVVTVRGEQRIVVTMRSAAPDSRRVLLRRDGHGAARVSASLPNPHVQREIWATDHSPSPNPEERPSRADFSARVWPGQSSKWLSDEQDRCRAPENGFCPCGRTNTKNVRSCRVPRRTSVWCTSAGEPSSRTRQLRACQEITD